jgi:DNA end-binding protein Ku
MRREREEALAARAIWKGVIVIGKQKVPVKLYSGVQDRTIHFRLLHRTDQAPVKQKLVDADRGEEVAEGDVRRAFPVTRTQLVALRDEELEKLEPEPSREIEISRFVDPRDIDHRWYERAYFLGPDSDNNEYFAVAEALDKKKKEGVAHWVMRGKQYLGALRAEGPYLMLITLRYAEEIVDASSLEGPGGRALDKRELAMAERLVDALAGRFDPSEYRDEYRARVMELVETREKGGRVKIRKFKPRPTKDNALTNALEASLAGLGKRAAGGRR